MREDDTPTPPATKASELIRRSIRAIQKHGWGQHFYQNGETGCLCMLGALRLASNERTPYEGDAIDYWGQGGIYNSAVSAIEKDLRANSYSTIEIATWNDMTARTRQQVLRQMGATARRLEAVGR